MSTPGEDEENVKKRVKAEPTIDTSEREDSPAQIPVKETEGVKEVTQGVKNVELEDGKPETVPLPVTPPPEPTIEQQAQPDEKLEVDTEKAEGGVEEEEEVNDKVEDKTPEDANPTQDLTSGKPADKLVATGTPAVAETTISTKTPRKTRNLPTKTAKSGSRVVRKVVESIEQKGRTPGEVVMTKKGDTSV